MSKQLNYIGQLDGLRAVSIIIVLLSHWISDTGIGEWFTYGRYGVDLFFVISGFLLTTILVGQKKSGLNAKRILKAFFVKRILRLFPAYYTLLIGLSVLSLITGFWIWHSGNGIYYYTYTANFLFFFKGHQAPSLNHTWSLCVEEQFYLILPWLVLFLSKRNMTVVALLSVISTPIICMLFPHSNSRIMVYGNFTTLYMGVLLAYHIDYIKQFLSNPKLFVSVFILILSCAVLTMSLWKSDIHDLFVGVLFALIVGYSTVGIPGLIGTFLNNKVVRYIGLISYGIYIYHRFIPHLIKQVANSQQIQINPFLNFILSLFVLIIIAVVSSKFIEKPFMRLKEKFDY